jgi:hypothetical protein
MNFLRTVGLPLAQIRYVLAHSPNCQNFQVPLVLPITEKHHFDWHSSSNMNERRGGGDVGNCRPSLNSRTAEISRYMGAQKPSWSPLLRVAEEYASSPLVIISPVATSLEPILSMSLPKWEFESAPGRDEIHNLPNDNSSGFKIISFDLFC